MDTLKIADFGFSCLKSQIPFINPRYILLLFIFLDVGLLDTLLPKCLVNHVDMMKRLISIVQVSFSITCISFILSSLT